MKKVYIIFSIILIAILLVLGIFYLTSFYKISINLKSPDLSVDLYARKSKDSSVKISSLKSSRVVSLRSGDYYAIPTNKKYSSTPIDFTVKDTAKSVVIKPDYSDEFLSSLLKTEYPAIKLVIGSRYAAVLPGFTLSTGRLYMDGTWYATTLVQKVPERAFGDTYRLIMKKENNTWKIAVPPKLVITRYDSGAVPMSVINGANQQQGN